MQLQQQGQAVTGNYFHMLGLPPATGRDFAPEDKEAPGSQPVVMLGHRFWQSRFHGDPGVVGRTLQLNGNMTCVANRCLPEVRFAVSVANSGGMTLSGSQGITYTQALTIMQSAFSRWTTPNVTCEKEAPGTFQMDAKKKFFQPLRPLKVSPPTGLSSSQL